MDIRLLFPKSSSLASSTSKARSANISVSTSFTAAASSSLFMTRRRTRRRGEWEWDENEEETRTRRGRDKDEEEERRWQRLHHYDIRAAGTHCWRGSLRSPCIAILQRSMYFFFCLGTDLCFEFGHLLSAHESFCNLDNGRSLSPHEDSSHFSCSESVHQQKGQTAGTINPKVYYSFSETINSQYTGFCEFPSNQMLFEPVATLDGTTTHIVLGEGRGGRAEEEDETMRRQWDDETSLQVTIFSLGCKVAINVDLAGI